MPSTASRAKKAGRHVRPGGPTRLGRLYGAYSAGAAKAPTQDQCQDLHRATLHASVNAWIPDRCHAGDILASARPRRTRPPPESRCCCCGCRGCSCCGSPRGSSADCCSTSRREEHGPFGTVPARKQPGEGMVSLGIMGAKAQSRKKFGPRFARAKGKRTKSKGLQN